MSVDSIDLDGLERKDRAQLATIAQALGGKPTSRTKKADIIEMILELAGVTPKAASGSVTPAGGAAPRSDDDRSHGDHRHDDSADAQETNGSAQVIDVTTAGGVQPSNGGGSTGPRRGFRRVDEPRIDSVGGAGSATPADEQSVDADPSDRASESDGDNGDDGDQARQPNQNDNRNQGGQNNQGNRNQGGQNNQGNRNQGGQSNQGNRNQGGQNQQPEPNQGNQNQAGQGNRNETDGEGEPGNRRRRRRRGRDRDRSEEQVESTPAVRG